MSYVIKQIPFTTLYVCPTRSELWSDGNAVCWYSQGQRGKLIILLRRVRRCPSLLRNCIVGSVRPTYTNYFSACEHQATENDD